MKLLRAAAHAIYFGSIANTERCELLQTMHELSIAMSLMDAIIEELPILGDVTVVAAHVRVGALSGVVPEALSFAFEVATDGSPLAGTSISIERSAGSELELLRLEVLDVDTADRGRPPQRPEEERSRRG
jgi:hydrogenase nickel incorporation protein HypA/HybF